MGEMLRSGSAVGARRRRVTRDRQGVQRNRTEAFRCFHASAMVAPSRHTLAEVFFREDTSRPCTCSARATGSDGAPKEGEERARRDRRGASLNLHGLLQLFRRCLPHEACCCTCALTLGDMLTDGKERGPWAGILKNAYTLFKRNKYASALTLYLVCSRSTR
eukprot:759358-Hanusia_phi.AAC.4